jgi:hypothetical protein
MSTGHFYEPFPCHSFANKKKKKKATGSSAKFYLRYKSSGNVQKEEKTYDV